MNVQEISAEGLSREIKITVSKDNLSSRLDTKLLDLKETVQLRGFRKGKVPTAHLKSVYGQQVMGDIVREVVNAESEKALTDREERPALQPEIKLDGEVELIMNGEADLVFNMIYDIIPPIKLTDFSKIKLKRQVATVSDGEVKQAIERLAQSRKQFEPRAKTAKAQKGDSVKIDFLGKVDGKAFESGTAENFDLELGSNQFIPGFEEQLIGTKAGDEINVALTFPEEYGSEALAGKPVVFECKVHDVSAPKAVEINDEFATSLGTESLKKLEEKIREQIGADYEKFTRERMKKELLDVLAEGHSFDLPTKMVDLEFQQIWQQSEQELANQNQKLEELDESEKDLRAEYRSIAERRVRTGLILAEVGRNQKIDITQDEVNQSLMQRVQQFPGQEQQVLEYFRSNPEAMAQLRAPIFEDKVIDFIVEKADVTDKTVSVEELTVNPDEKAKPKAKAKKTPAKKPVAKKAPAKKPVAKKSTKKSS